MGVNACDACAEPEVNDFGDDISQRPLAGRMESKTSPSTQNAPVIAAFITEREHVWNRGQGLADSRMQCLWCLPLCWGNDNKPNDGYTTVTNRLCPQPSLPILKRFAALSSSSSGSTKESCTSGAAPPRCANQFHARRGQWRMAMEVSMAKCSAACFSQEHNAALHAHIQGPIEQSVSLEVKTPVTRPEVEIKSSGRSPKIQTSQNTLHRISPKIRTSQLAYTKSHISIMIHRLSLQLLGHMWQGITQLRMKYHV